MEGKMNTYAVFDNGTAELVIIRLLNVEVKEALDIYFQGFQSNIVKESARKGIECAYESLFSMDIKAYIQKTPISLMVKGFQQQVDGSSAGLAYAIAFAVALKKEDMICTPFELPEFIAATGEVDIIGNVKKIKCLKEKILGAINNHVNLIFYPSQNNEELGLLMKQDEEFSNAVKNSGIELQDVSSIRQLFYKIGILPVGTIQEEFPGKEDQKGSKQTTIAEKSNKDSEYAENIDLHGKAVRNVNVRNRYKIFKIMLLLSAIVIGILIYGMIKPSAARAPAPVNLALNRIAYASSEENSTNSTANAFDGNSGTRWSSEYSDKQWIYVDLGRSMTISCVILNWEAAYARQYQIQVSDDGSSWAVVYTNNNNAGGVNVINFETINARYVKMYAWQRGTQFGYSLWEFEVYAARHELPSVSKKPQAINAAIPSKANSRQFVKVNAKKPFPQKLNFKGCIKPNNKTQQQMDSEIKSYYDYWKKSYLSRSNGVTPGGGYYLKIKGTSGNLNEKTISSVHGYGMIIFALMAGYDSKAKQYFDGMYNMYNHHRSTVNKNNMSWVIDETEDMSKDSDSSTDGDMDIAYSLLLADSQWGSDGAINYYAEAKRIITSGIKGRDISHSTYKTLLGDWSDDQNRTRVSDLMTGHFHAFYKATGDPFWWNVISTSYQLVAGLTSLYSPNTGLVPDFIVNYPARPAESGAIEGALDFGYGSNACCYPLRCAADFAHYGSSNSKEICSKIITWLKKATNNNPSNIKTGYSLEGKVLDDDSSIKFTAPFIAACIASSENQRYLNEGWRKISNWREKCDGDSFNLLCMLLISGNWWAPN
jgi:endo-1,4-beta-D-glucanase Y